MNLNQTSESPEAHRLRMKAGQLRQQALPLEQQVEQLRLQVEQLHQQVKLFEQQAEAYEAPLRQQVSEYKRIQQAAMLIVDNVLRKVWTPSDEKEVESITTYLVSEIQEALASLTYDGHKWKFSIGCGRGYAYEHSIIKCAITKLTELGFSVNTRALPNVLVTLTADEVYLTVYGE